MMFNLMSFPIDKMRLILYFITSLGVLQIYIFSLRKPKISEKKIARAILKVARLAIYPSRHSKFLMHFRNDHIFESLFHQAGFELNLDIRIPMHNKYLLDFIMILTCQILA